MNIRSDLARIEQKLEDMSIRQEKWYDLLTGRIKEYDDTVTKVGILMKIGSVILVAVVGLVTNYFVGK